MSTVRSENSATPATAATVVAPPSTAPLVPVPGVSASVTLVVAVLTVLPNPSCTVTRTAGASVTPAAVVAGGCTVNASRVAAPAVTPKLALVADVSPLAVPVRV